MELYFSDFFEVDEDTVENYGAFNVSLLTDFPLFIDPFLLFNSSKPEFKALHDDIIRYLAFLRDKAVSGQVTEGLLRSWYHFSEVEQNWLGFSQVGNAGRGLGAKFAKSLHGNLQSLFSDFGGEKVTRGSHLEKLCLIESGVGKDSISDFTTNLIKHFLLEYTQTFAQQHISQELTRAIRVPRVRFNYATESWTTETFTLPYHEGDYVILSPKDLLTR